MMALLLRGVVLRGSAGATVPRVIRMQLSDPVEIYRVHTVALAAALGV